MGSIETRPVDNFTADNVLIGMPFLEIGLEDGAGGYEAYRNVGIIDTAAIAKELEVIALRSAQSGTDVLIRELVRSFEGRINVTVYNFDEHNMQLMFSSSSQTAINAGTASVTDEEISLATTDLQWTDLAHQGITGGITVTCDEVEDEAVGTGDGTLGDASGDYSLDFKVNAVGDVTSVTVGGTSYTPIAVGAAAAGNEVEVVTGNGATSGDLQFFVGGVAANVTGAIVATYEPSFALTEDTDYAIDYQDGRIRRIVGGATDKLKASQPVLVDYTYTTYDGFSIEPFTQYVFAGRARLRLLTDVGINILWTIPSVNIRLTDDDFEFSRDEFAAGALAVTLLDDGTATPYGTLEVYDENAA
jgi:hypothetical protein